MNDLPDWSDQLVFTSDLIGLNTAFTGNALAAGAFIDLSTAVYASLVVVMNSAVQQVLQFDWHQATTVGGIGDTVQFTDYLTNIDVAVTPEWLVPVRGGSVRVTNKSAGAVNLVVYGSGRQSDVVTQLGPTSLARSFQFNGAYTAGVVVVLPALDGLGNASQLNGQIYMRFASSSIVGLVGFRYLNQNGAVRDVYVGTVVAGGNFFGIISQPACPVWWIVLPNTTAASTGFSLDLIQV